MNRQADIDLMANSMLAMPSIGRLIALGRLRSIALAADGNDATDQIGNLAAAHHIPVVRIAKDGIRKSIAAWLREYPCERVLVMTFPYKIPADLLKEHPGLFVNFHFGLLPAYRGADPVFWEIKNREPFGAVSVHLMDSGWDTGPLILIHKVPVGQNDTHGMHWNRLAGEGAVALEQYLLKNDAAVPVTPELQQGGTYFPRPVYKDVKIDWNEASASGIAALIRACNPWNKGAFSFLNGIELRIAEAFVSSDRTDKAPGSVIISEAGRTLAVACKDGSLLIPTVFCLQEGFFSSGTLLSWGVGDSYKFH
jgi:methionyl-tRNA formyltransferase